MEQDREAREADRASREQDKAPLDLLRAQLAQQQNGRLTPGTTVNQRFAPPQHHATPQPSANHMAAHSPGAISHPPPSPHIQQPNGTGHGYANATFSPTAHVQPVSTPGAMGPPPHLNAPKPAVPVKSYQYEMDDSLAGTGINLDEEEQYMNDLESLREFRLVKVTKKEHNR